MRPPRSLLVAAALLLTLVTAGTAMAASPARLRARDAAGDATVDVTALSLDQAGLDLLIGLTGPHPTAITRAHPLCLTFGWAGGDRRRVCLTRSRSGQPRAAVANLVSGKHASVETPLTRTTWGTRFSLRVPDVALAYGSIDLRLGGCTGCDRVPDTGSLTFKLARAVAIGCIPAGAHVRDRGPATMTVGLSFDDGPGAATGRVASIVRRAGDRATFFQIGRQVPGTDRLERRLLADGDTLGDHSWKHETLPGRASMARTQHAIASASRFRPCLFRPPGGAMDARVVADAWSLHMQTIRWNVDPQDWARPGSAAIASRVLSQTRPGSIILMHDGGGDRSETVAALPRILSTLHARGYRIVPVEELLGLAMRWRYR